MSGNLNLMLQQRMQQIAEHRLVKSGRHWYESLPPRDRKVVMGVGALLVLALIFSLVYAPLLRARDMAASQLERSRATYQLLAENAGRFSSVGGAASDAPLLTVVTQQARSSGISLSRYEQDGQALRIWLDKAAFDDAIGWLEELQARHGIRASQISVDKTDVSGRVDIRATLNR